MVTKKREYARGLSESIGDGAPHMELLLMTPEMAQLFLENQETNRTLSPAGVHKLATDILSGRWVLNGETIKFNANGRMVDGQHRCAAVIKADRAVSTWVNWNVDDDAMRTVDIGKTRSASDILAISEVGDYNVVAAACRILYLWESGTIEVLGSGSEARSVSTPAVLDYFDEHPGVTNSLTWGNQLRSKMPKAIAVALHYRISTNTRSDQDLVNQFFGGLASGLNLSGDDPRYWLIKKYAAIKRGKWTRAAHLSVIEATVKGWNAFRTGRPVHRFIALNGSVPIVQ